MMQYQALNATTGFVQRIFPFYAKIRLFGTQLIGTTRLVSFNAPDFIPGNAFGNQMCVIMTPDGTTMEILRMKIVAICQMKFARIMINVMHMNTIIVKIGRSVFTATFGVMAIRTVMMDLTRSL